MEQGVVSKGTDEEEPLALPPGFRFHPTDEELITHYLSRKVIDSRFDARAIGEADLNKCEPWDLPWRAKMGEKEWYFFCVKDRKYPTGLRTNRATESGYWKATGKDKEIYRGKTLVGMKKTLVFYKGRAPKGEKTNWVMHEFRLDDNKFSSFPKTLKNEWVISRVFQKSSGGLGLGLVGLVGGGGGGGGVKKGIGFMGRGSSGEDDEVAVVVSSSSPLLPPLMDMTYSNNSNSSSSKAHVTCFSNGMDRQKGHENLLTEDHLNPLLLSSTANPPSSDTSKLMPPLLQVHYNNNNTNNNGLQFYQSGGSLVQLLESNGYYGGMKGSCKTERDQMLSISQETGLTSDMNPEISSVAHEDPSSSSAAHHLHHLHDYIWTYE